MPCRLKDGLDLSMTGINNNRVIISKLIEQRVINIVYVSCK